jgi:uncharacterized SAM-binding protein YcdF (DUF218 family)
LRVVRKLVSLLITAAIAYLILSGVQVVLASRASSSPSAYHRASAIVVLGASIANEPSKTAFTRRLTTAATLYAAHLSRRVIVTGTGDSEASQGVIDLASSWLESHGVPDTVITPVGATDAVGGLRGVDRSLGNGSTVLVVTNAIDDLWTKGAAASAGLSPQVVPAAGSKVAVYTEVAPLARQASGVAAGRIIGDLRATWAAS